MDPSHSHLDPLPRASEENWADLVTAHFRQASDLLIVALDPEGRVREFNAAAERATGYRAEEVLGRSWFDLFAPQDQRPEVWAEFQRLLAGGAARRFQNPIRTRSGEPRIITWCNDVLYKDGHAVGTLSYGQDITQQVQAHEETTKHHEILARIFDTTHLCLVYLDREFNFIRVNKAYADVCARPADFFPGKNHFDLYPHAENEALFRKVVETGEPITVYAKPFTFPDHPEWGVTYWDWTLHPLKDPQGHVEGLLFLLLDVTERKRMEAQLLQMQRMDALGRLAGGIAHDFNNLLTAIQGYAQLGEIEAKSHARILEQFRGIEGIADRAAQLTRQLLAFARRQTTHREVVDLNALTQGLCRLLRHLLGDGVELIAVPAPEPCPVKADVAQLEQVLVNLAINARDAMEGSGTLTVEIAPLASPLAPPSPGLPPGPWVQWKVRDTGPGMAPEVAARIFEPFFTTKTDTKGTGLGLATCHGIVRQHGGAILLDTAPGQGACFTVLLPRAEEMPTVEIAPSRVLPKGTETLLIVEDQPAVRQSAVRTLLPLGYSVLEAGHGEEALRSLAAHAGPVQLALVDLMLPGQGGEEVAQRLRDLRPDLKVLFVSGYAEVLPEALQAHAPWAAFLDKPYTPSHLAQAVRALLDRTPEEALDR